MSIPEQLKANDIFSIGCIVKELFTGTPLFTTESILLFMNNQLKPDLKSVIDFLLFSIFIPGSNIFTYSCLLE